MTRTSGEYADWVDGPLNHSCGFSDDVAWNYDPVVDRTRVATTCPKCGADVELSTSEGVF